MFQLVIVAILLLVLVPSSMFWVDQLAEALHQSAMTIWTTVAGIGLGSVVWGAFLTGRKR